jgi:hypothetical protein
MRGTPILQGDARRSGQERKVGSRSRQGLVIQVSARSTAIRVTSLFLLLNQIPINPVLNQSLTAIRFHRPGSLPLCFTSKLNSAA